MDRDPSICSQTVRACHFPQKSSSVLRLALQPLFNPGCSGTIVSRIGGEFLRLLPIGVRGRGGGPSRCRRAGPARGGGNWGGNPWRGDRRLPEGGGECGS